MESTLGTADAPNLELRDRIISALGYTISWSKAVAGGISNTLTAGPDGSYIDESAALTQLAARVSQMQQALTGLLALIPVDGVFPTKDAVAKYEDVSAGFAQLYRDLTLNAATLPQPGLLDTASGIASGFFEAPGAVLSTLAEDASNSIARTLGKTTAAIWSALWPWLLLAGGVGLVYVFRAPLGRALGKVAA